ncbi:DUF1993 domain-containing protein [Chitinimonas sp.]|uniref:DUF1993 domain-containing protein n=1 Tax=Chitinimonas sp. TaxID=1934313 RepID=UPI002F924B7B
MSLSMYQASIPGFVRTLKNLDAILDKAVACAEARKYDPTVLVGCRLAPDMLPLARQIQIATDGVKGCAARLAGIEVPSYADDEATIAELKARIAKTIAFLESVPADKIEGSEERVVTIKLRGKDTEFKAVPYLFHFVIPNFYFHVTTAYDILRHNGVEIGKRDYLGEY